MNYDKTIGALRAIKKANKLAGKIKKGIKKHRWSKTMNWRLKRAVTLTKKNVPILEKSLGKEATYKIIHDTPVELVTTGRL